MQLQNDAKAAFLIGPPPASKRGKGDSSRALVVSASVDKRPDGGAANRVTIPDAMAKALEASPAFEAATRSGVTIVKAV